MNAASDGTLIDLSAFTGFRGVDAERQVATLAAATPLWEAGPLLYRAGYGFKNMGDIDRQTLGGVVGTGTHGTGPTLKSFSGDVAGFRLVTADGSVLDCSETENPDVFAAGRCSLGMLGVRCDRDRDVCAPGLQTCRKELPDAAGRRCSRNSTAW